MNRTQHGFGIIGLFTLVVVAAIVVLAGWQVSQVAQNKGVISTALQDLHIANPLAATVTGTVTEGPTTPVCIVGKPCVEPVANHTLEALNASGAVAAQTTTTASGTYTLELVPGQYTLTLVPKVGFNLVGSQLVVISGTQTHNLSADTGLR